MRTPPKVLAALSASSLLLAGLAACGTPEDPASSGPGTAPTAITVRGCTPENPLIATNTNEVCGGNVIDAASAGLVRYNPDDASPMLDIAEKIETTDAVNWTVTLKQGYKFQDGTEVKAKNFVDAWNWAAYGPNGQLNSYFFEMIEGYADLQCAEADCATPPAAEAMSGLKVVDDYTFTIKTTSPTSNLEVRLGYSAFVPQPDVFFADTSEGKKEFAKLPVTAGPYKITSVTDTEIVLEKFADYSGEYPGSIDKVTFVVYDSMDAAYMDVLANELDLTDQVPSSYLINDQWQQDAAGRNAVADTGIIQAITYSSIDPGLADIRIRQAISMAVDRQEIATQIFADARVPATGWVSPVVDGYKEGACTACEFNPTKAKELYDAAGGYPGTLSLWVNGDGGHDEWATAMCNQLKNNLGLDCTVQTTPNFSTLRQKINARELTGMFRTGWQMDYPSIENFLTPIYATGASSNDGDYSSAEFDKLLKDAAAATDPEQANQLYQQAEAILGQDMPTMPTFYQQSQYIYSTKIKSVKMTPFSKFDFGSIELN